jgi:hypothetical protein
MAADRNQDSVLFLVLVVVRRIGRWIALSFALRSFFVLFSLFFLAAGPRCPLSFGPISPVIWLKRHHILLSDRLISVTGYKYDPFEICLPRSIS